eukprot:11333305-Alexandrium_andersonii.AAC.1
MSASLVGSEMCIRDSPLACLVVPALLIAHCVPCLAVVIHGVLPVRDAGARIAVAALDLILGPALGIRAGPVGMSYVRE